MNEDKWIDEISDKVVSHMTAIMEENVKQMEYQDLFADMGIGKGEQEYNNAKKRLWDNMVGEDEYEWEAIIRELADWCEV